MPQQGAVLGTLRKIFSPILRIKWIWRVQTLLFPFYWWENWGSMRSSIQLTFSTWNPDTWNPKRSSFSFVLLYLQVTEASEEPVEEAEEKWKKILLWGLVSCGENTGFVSLDSRVGSWISISQSISTPWAIIICLGLCWPL